MGSEREGEEGRESEVEREEARGLRDTGGERERARKTEKERERERGRESRYAQLYTQIPTRQNTGHRPAAQAQAQEADRQKRRTAAEREGVC